MARIFITGSAQGLGLMTGQLLAEGGHEVVLHARDAARAAATRAALPAVAGMMEGDVATLAGMRAVAAQVNAFGSFDAVIHNVAIGYREPRRDITADGLPALFATNVLAPYALTALMHRPRRLIYLSSGMHHHVRTEIDDMLWERRRWNGSTAYAESKLYDAMLAFAIARQWPDTISNALEPGWVPTRMGGAGAPDDMDQAHRTQAWLAVSNDPAAMRSGRYFYHLEERAANPEAHDPALARRLLDRCAAFSKIELPS